MRFHDRRELEGKHAFLSPSKYYWIDYDQERLAEAWNNSRAMEEGVELHDFARRCIERRVKLPRKKDTLNQYVNDAIKYGLTPEQPLYYSENCFGTADAIGFDDSATLRIFDLKTGKGRTDMRQLKIYAALFMLEYDIAPYEVVLRIYQNKEYREERPSLDDIRVIAGTIVEFDTLVTQWLQDEHFK